MTDLTTLEQRLADARDALIAYWEQSEGQACFIALQQVDDALADYQALDSEHARIHDPARWERIQRCVAEITQLRAPLGTST